MVSLRVVLLLSLSLLPTISIEEGNKLKCGYRPPPQVNVIPFLPQDPLVYEDCDASTDACFYFRYHGSRTSRSFPVHGCAAFHKLPDGCDSGAEIYHPHWGLDHEGREFVGSIKCCSTDYCNEIEEAMFVPVHFDPEDEAGDFKIYWLFPILLTIFVALIFIDQLHDIIYEIRVFLGLEEDVDGTVQAVALAMNPLGLPIFPDNGGPFLEYTAPNITGFFTSMNNMLDVIREIEKWRPEVEAEKERELKREERRGRGGGRKKHGRETNVKELTVNKCISNRQASEHVDSKVFREIPTRLTDLLARLIEHGPYEFPFDPNELGDLFDKASEVLGDEPSVIEVDFGVHVIGNLEGSYINLFRWFYIFGWPPKEKFIFLGGAIHPENPYSLEVLALILALKMKMPNQIYLIRGNAEGQPLNMGDRFPPRVSETLREVASKALTRLPLAVLINKQILCIHSSLPNGMTTVEEINQIRRPFTTFHKESLEAYLFNAIPDDVMHRPTDQLTNNENRMAHVDEIIEGFLRKGSLMFLPKDLEETAKRLKLDLIIRGKSVCQYGISALTERVFSLWSTQYFGETMAGAAMMVDTNGSISITRLYKFGCFNEDSSSVSQVFLEESVVEELERLEIARRGEDELDAIHFRVPTINRMGFYV